MVHRWLSPTRGPKLIRAIRGLAGQSAYSRSHLVRFLEEGLAESAGALSLRKGFSYGLRQVNGGRAAAEGVLYLGGIGAAGYAASGEF